MNALRERQLAALADLKPALIVVDVQRSFGDPDHLTGYELSPADASAVASAIEETARLVDSARASGVEVFWVELASEPSRPLRSSMWLQDGDPAALPGGDFPCLVGTPGAEWYGVAPAPGEVVVQKTGYSGFVGTDLAERLQASGIGWVSGAGLTTECCIDATATYAFHAELLVLIPADAVAAYSRELNRTALEQLALTVAVVSSVDELATLWEVTA